MMLLLDYIAKIVYTISKETPKQEDGYDRSN